MRNRKNTVRAKLGAAAGSPVGVVVAVDIGGLLGFGEAARANA
jgi:hypothetical protein